MAGVSWRSVARGLGACLALSGCRGEARTTGGGPYADKVAADVPQIEKAVGVPFKHPPKLEVRTRAQVREFVLAQLRDSIAQRELAGKEAAYKVLGLIPETMDVRKLFLDLYTEQILGYYDPHTKVLYVVQGAPDEYVGVTIMHELVHALQDQYVNLDSLQRATGDDDRQTAAQAVIEGEATYEQLATMLGGKANLGAALPGGWDRMRDVIRETYSSQPVFGAAPKVIQEELLFPYINGAEFVRRFPKHVHGWERGEARLRGAHGADPGTGDAGADRLARGRCSNRPGSLISPPCISCGPCDRTSELLQGKDHRTNVGGCASAPLCLAF